MFNSNDHNRKGSRKEVKHCCNCLYNNHGQLYFSGPPNLYCTHPKAKGEPNKELKYDLKEKIGDFLIRMMEFEENNEIIHDEYGNRGIWYPTCTEEQSKKFHEEIKNGKEDPELPDNNEHLMLEQLKGFPKWCPLEKGGLQ